MPDSITFALDTTPVEQAAAALTPALQQALNAACEATAEAVVKEAKARLGRQLKGTSVATKDRPDLGAHLTLEGIHAQPAYDGNGWVVLSDREPFPNVVLWLEKGTHGSRRHTATAAESYFYPALALEAGNHARRIEDAMQAAAAETGLGG
jgi:hypothetical protein